MPIELDEIQRQIRDSILQICQKYPEDFWLEKDRRGGFPDDFAQDIADAGWLGIALPEAYGGAGLGVREAAVMMMAIAVNGARNLPSSGAVKFPSLAGLVISRLGDRGLRL